MTLGLTDEEFEFLPLDEYRAFVETYGERQKARLWDMATLCSTIMNQHPYRTKHVRPEDLIPAQRKAGDDGLGLIRMMLDAANKKKADEKKLSNGQAPL